MWFSLCSDYYLLCLHDLKYALLILFPCLITYLQIDFLDFPRRMDILLDSNCSPARLSHISEKHPKITLGELNVLRRHRELCDVVLNVGSRKIFAHRVILSACSPYFRAMFTGELEESRQTEVTIRDIDENAMELLIDFCYTSHIVVEESNVQSLLPAACLLQLSEIQDICCEFLKRQLDPSNCLGIRAFADTHS